MIPTVGFLSLLFSITCNVQRCLESVLIRLYAGRLFTNLLVTLKAIDQNLLAYQYSGSPDLLRGFLRANFSRFTAQCELLFE